MNLKRRTFLNQAGRVASASVISKMLAPESHAQGPVQQPLPDVLLPYLQNPAADAMSICLLARGVNSVTALVKGEGEPAVIETIAFSRVVPATPWTFWKARVTGLKPGRSYEYQLKITRGNDSETTPARVFRMLDPGAESVKAIVFNDIHNRLPTLESLLAHVKPHDFEFTIFNGDMINDPSAANGAEVAVRLWNDYVRLLDGARKPILFVRGNHEVRGSFCKNLGYMFDLPLLDATSPEEEQQWQYGFNAGPVHFLMMDTGEDDDPGTDPASYKRPRFWEAFRRKQTAWLEKHVATPAVKNARHRVFVSHIPLHNPAGWYSIVSRDEWSARIAAAGFDVMLAGHDHSWKFVRGKQPFTIKKGPATDTAPVPVIIGGGPHMPEGTVIFLTADSQGLRTRMISAEGGRMLHQWRA